MWHFRRARRTRVLPGPLRGPGGVIAERVTWCTTLSERIRGVLGRSPLEPDEAYVILDAPKVHTVGVPYPLDAVFCDKRWRVLHVQTLQPRSRSERVAGAKYCVELLGGRAAEHGIAVGDRLSFGDDR
jgi:uncharacterized membrane protein (UPF0127 family)